AGTTPSLDPYSANVFSRQTLSRKFLEINPVLVDELRSLGLWEQVRHRLVEERGDVSLIEDIPLDVRRRFPTAYQIPPEAYIEVAARAQKWEIGRASCRDVTESKEVDMKINKRQHNR